MTKILIAGDFCPRARVAELIEKEQFSEIFKDTRQLIQSADYSIVNLECPIVLDGVKPIEKCGPNLKCSSKAVDALKYAGFNMVTLANNHFYDFGDIGVMDTLKTLESNHLRYVGGGNNLAEASNIYYQHHGDDVIAIINCCEHEFSIATENSAGANALNPIRQYYAITEARSKADFVIVIVHGGVEHYQLPTPRMQIAYRFFIDSGADAVINHHQHCYSGYESYKGKPIFYGLGNFCFDWDIKRSSPWNYGYMVELSLSKTLSFKIYPYKQCNQDPGITLLQGEEENKVLEHIVSLSNIIVHKADLSNCYEQYIDSLDPRTYKSVFEPYIGRILSSLYLRGFLPSLISKSRRIQILNYISCESHYDKLIHIINKIQ